MLTPVLVPQITVHIGYELGFVTSSELIVTVLAVEIGCMVPPGRLITRELWVVIVGRCGAC